MSARILVIEDSSFNLRLMTYLLGHYGYETLEANDGAPGLELLRTQDVDLVLCDVQMPTVDGYAVVAAIKADPRLRSLPVIAISALAMVGDRDRILKAGFDGYIAKPIVPESFVDRVEGYIPEHRRAHSDAHDPAATTDSAEPAPITPSERGTILVVDDIAANLHVVRSVLEPSGYVVVTASTGAEGIAAMRLSPPRLILSDLHLGGEEDFSFVRTVKADPAFADIPFVFLSSTTRKRSIAETARSLGAVRFLFRPLDPQVLLSEIEDCLSQAHEGIRSDDG